MSSEVPNAITYTLAYDGLSPSNAYHMTDFAYDGPIFLVPLSLSYPSSPVYHIVSNSNYLQSMRLG